MREYEIWRIVDVNMYNTLLSPEVALEEGVLDDAQESAREPLWNRFDLNKYKAFICERAVVELKKLLKRLPNGMRVRYVEGSAEIYSPPYYNYGGDELIFRITARSHRSQKSMQRYLENFFREEWNMEFGPDYAIYEYIRNNKGLEDFLMDETSPLEVENEQ